MTEERGFDFLDILIFLEKRKKTLILMAIFVSIISYSFIYFLIEEKYESSTLIIPSENQSFGGLGSMLSKVADIPSGLGGLLGGSSVDLDLFYTIIYSRTTLDTIIHKFDLRKEYKKDSWEKTRKELMKNIITEETEYKALQITCTSNSPTKAAEMANYLVELLNKKIIEFNIRKSKENREFIEERLNEIKDNLELAEDAMALFQKNTGLYEVESQLKATFDAYAKLETELATEQIKSDVISKIYGDDSQKVKDLKIGVEEYKKKINKIKNAGDNENLILPMSKLSDKAINYYRNFRNIEIYNAMLKFVIPMHEQAKFEEQKNIPILQIIDQAIPPEKRSYPPRMILTILITFFVVTFYLIISFLKKVFKTTSNEKLKILYNDIFVFKRK